MKTAVGTAEVLVRILFVFSIVCFVLYLIRIVYMSCAFLPEKRYEEADHMTRFAILIPARNESGVIANLMEALKKQRYPEDCYDVYVIVETVADPTVSIVSDFGYRVFVRPDLEGKRSKGWALDQCVRTLLDKKYESFVIFDADNLPASDFLLAINRMRMEKGYRIGLGNRQSLNYEKNRISMCSTLMLQMISLFGCKGKMRLFQKIVLCGTGYYIDADVLRDAGGFPWHGLCEDNELTIYAYANDIPCGYCAEAVFFDEQPMSYAQNLTQHIRWTWGVLETTHAMRPKVLANWRNGKQIVAKTDFLISNVPLAALIFFSFFVGIYHWILGLLVVFQGGNGNRFFAVGLMIFLFYEILFSFVAWVCIKKNEAYLKKVSRPLKFWCIVTFLFYISDFLTAFFCGIPKKNRIWKPIEHFGQN